MVETGPQRSCIFCRTARNKEELLRFVISPERIVVPDLQNKLPGRGAYTCMNLKCLQGAADRKQFSRAFKGEVGGADAEGLIRQVKERIRERTASYISLANKAGKAVSGTDAVQEHIRNGTTGLLFIASDISEDIGAKIRAQASRYDIETSSIFDREILGSLLGKEMRVVVAIESSGFISPLKQEIAKFRNFFEGGR